MNSTAIHQIIPILKKEVGKWEVPIVTMLSLMENNPFKILIATVLSLRTKDETTAVASKKLFDLASTPSQMVKLKEETIAKAIFPVGFYHTKAKRILEICEILIQQYDEKVPDDLDALLKLPGVGRKTANLVITLGYGKPGICVDTHVHRISNRFGYVLTKTPEQTEFALRKKLPTQYWIAYNDLLVAFGQNLCRPISPKCSICPVAAFCDRVGVETSR